MAAELAYPRRRGGGNDEAEEEEEEAEAERCLLGCECGAAETW